VPRLVGRGQAPALLISSLRDDNLSGDKHPALQIFVRNVRGSYKIWRGARPRPTRSVPLPTLF